MSKDEKQEILKLTAEEIEALKDRLAKKELKPEDYDTLAASLTVMALLRLKLTKSGAALNIWLKRIFGLKTEKKPKSKKDKNASKDDEGKSSEDSNRNGHNGRDDYPGANKINVPHEEYKPGCECPECHKGKLVEDKPAVDYDWKGSAPLTLDIYLLQRLICHTCKSIFTAKSPVAETAKTVDDSADDPKTDTKVTRCNRNALANAVVACLHYLYGIPFYRLEKIQGSLGMGIAASTQYLMVLKVYEAAVYIYLELMKEAAQAHLIMADDTWIKILDWMAGHGPPNKTNGNPLKQAKTSAVVAKLTSGHSIALYMTNQHEAGHCVDTILKKREADSGTLIYKCDGLAGNLLKSSANIITTFCLDHSRRKFVELESIFPEESAYALELFAPVYKADKEAKNLGLTEEERLQYHQEHSSEPMQKLGEWLMKQKEIAEANGPLAAAINYSLKRWTELNEFLHTPGVPLSNAECERIIKTIIPYRKNSLFYKTKKGAKIGAVIQSLIETCKKNDVNCFEYLAWIQENKSKVKANPADFLPWKFQKKA